MNIPFTKPYWGNEEKRALSRSLKQSIGTGDGPATHTFIKQMQELLGVPYVLPVTSCTHGLELILCSLGLKAQDEVIVPSFTMSSTANAVVMAGARPVFADIEPVRYTIDPADIKRRITPRTKGIIVVHYAGMPCFMEEIMAIARKHKLFIIEDAAHTIGASYKGKPLGTFGLASSFSFHGTKNVCCGEGGAVVTADAKLADTMEIYRANGTNRREFLRGAVDKYTWVGKGTSFFLSDLLASILVSQLRKLPAITRKRVVIAKRYLAGLKGYTDVVTLPVVPDGADPNWHIFALRFHTPDAADFFLQEMRNKGIGVSTHYVPLHSSPMGRSLSGAKQTSLPVTESVSRTLVRLPIYPGLSENAVQYILHQTVRTLKQIRKDNCQPIVKSK